MKVWEVHAALSTTWHVMWNSTMLSILPLPQEAEKPHRKAISRTKWAQPQQNRHL